jgi:hypothetical protein
MGQSQPGAAHLLSWLWREQRIAAFLGAWDCYRVMSFTIPRAGSYRVCLIVSVVRWRPVRRMARLLSSGDNALISRGI